MRVLSLSFLVLMTTAIARAEPSGFRAPEGFRVELFAGDGLAHDIYCMTLDVMGRPVVASRDYIKTLIDEDGDGVADQAVPFTSWPPGSPHGLLADGHDLLVSTGTGLYRLVDADADGLADGPPERLAISYGGGEHSSNGIVKGPDGWFWWIHGNDAGVGAEHIRSSQSPVRTVNCGAVVRIAPDNSRSEVFAHGFRNPYDLAFGVYGHVFTYDADGERVQHLPWYSPTRVFDIAQGMHHGWVLKKWKHAWNQAESNCDNVERLAEVGRGSPTGVVVYRHLQFPERYRGGLLAMCWSKGRIYHLPMHRRGSTFDAELEVFVETRGHVGFAPVDLDVGPQGDLFVAIGGRGTRGSVFRVIYAAEKSSKTPVSESQKRSVPILDVLRADQPFAAWSRARWVPQAKKLGRAPFESFALDAAQPTLERIRAIEILVELFEGVTHEVAAKLVKDDDYEVAARALWAVSCSPSPAGFRLAMAATRHADPRVLRAAWEALAGSRIPDVSGASPDGFGGLAHPDRRVRAATVMAMRGAAIGGPWGAADSPLQLGERADPRSKDPRSLVGWLRVTAPARSEFAGKPGWFDVAIDAFDATQDPVTRLAVLRMIVRGLGDVALVQESPQVTDGYQAAFADSLDVSTRKRMVAAFAKAFPSGNSDVDREIARTIAMLEVDATAVLERMGDLWRSDSDVVDDIHYLLAAGRIRGVPSAKFSRSAASAFASLHRKMRDGGREASRFWPTRIVEAYEQLRQSVEGLDSHLVADLAFGDVEHTVFAAALMDKEALQHANDKLLARATETARWSSELVRHLGKSDAANVVEALRGLWEDASLRDAVSLVLAAKALPADYGRLVEALGAVRGDVVRAAARALARFEQKLDASQLAEVMKALRRFCSHPREKSTRAALTELLTYSSGVRHTVKEREDGSGAHGVYAPWFSWFANSYPDQAMTLSREDSDTVEELLSRLSGDVLDRGDSERGKVIFQRRGCEGCHRGTRRLGPDLKGVGSRFSTRDLLVAIVDPDRDISPAYVATQVVTRDGSVHRGLMVYQSPAATLMQTTADSTVRFAAKDVLQIGKSSESFMPKGLLDGLSDVEVADLLAYLKALGSAE